MLAPFTITFALMASAAFVFKMAATFDPADSLVLIEREPIASPVEPIEQIDQVAAIDDRKPPPLEALLERPVFEPTRRPRLPEPILPNVEVEPKPDPIEEVSQKEETETAPLELEAAEIPPPIVQLLGVLSTDGVLSALIATNGDAPQWMKVGDFVSGWAITKISDDQVFLSESDRTLEFKLYRK